MSSMILTPNRYQKAATRIARAYGLTCQWDSSERCYWVHGDVDAKTARSAEREAKRIRSQMFKPAHVRPAAL